jgi:hypothetical protein
MSRLTVNHGLGKIHLKQNFYNGNIRLGYHFEVPRSKFYIEPWVSLHLLRGRSRVAPDFISSAGYWHDYGVSETGWDSAKYTYLPNNANLYSMNVQVGLNAGYHITPRLDVLLGMYAEVGLRNMLTTGMVVAEYPTGYSNQDFRGSNTTAISNSTGFGYTLGVSYRLTKITPARK